MKEMEGGLNGDKNIIQNNEENDKRRRPAMTSSNSKKKKKMEQETSRKENDTRLNELYRNMRVFYGGVAKTKRNN